ncbi:brassinosteroid-responsive RING protein [Trifolium repens]|nr:brassinosteroid-responsive RING protein [Trifolium repens]
MFSYQDQSNGRHNFDEKYVDSFLNTGSLLPLRIQTNKPHSNNLLQRRRQVRRTLSPVKAPGSEPPTRRVSWKVLVFEWLLRCGARQCRFRGNRRGRGSGRGRRRGFGGVRGVLKCEGISLGRILRRNPPENPSESEKL